MCEKIFHDVLKIRAVKIVNCFCMGRTENRDKMRPLVIQVSEVGAK